MIIAIDGPAASGKGTLARRLADQLNFAYLDTGKIYRAVGLGVVRAGGDPAQEEDAAAVARKLSPADLNDPDLKGDDAAQAASKAAAHPAVREALLTFQRDFAASPPDGKAGAVLDGRDIGTVVCPDAPVKLFVTAGVDVRAQRRHKELLDRGESSIYQRVLEDLKERDDRDRNRKTAPLKPAADATTIDTSELTPTEALDAALDVMTRVQDGN